MKKKIAPCWSFSYKPSFLDTKWVVTDSHTYCPECSHVTHFTHDGKETHEQVEVMSVSGVQTNHSVLHEMKRAAGEIMTVGKI